MEFDKAEMDVANEEEMVPVYKTEEKSKVEEQKSETTDGGEDTAQAGDDFMTRIESNSRLYRHGLRKGWSKFGNRVDFTETIYFRGSSMMNESKSN